MSNHFTLMPFESGGGKSLPLPFASRPELRCSVGHDAVTMERLSRPPHRPCMSRIRSQPSLGRVDLPVRHTAVPMWFRVAYSGPLGIIVRNTSGVILFWGNRSDEPRMSFSAELVPCCRTRTLPDGTQEKFYWLLIYTDPSTCTWREEFFRRKYEAEAAQKALWDKWGIG